MTSQLWNATDALVKSGSTYLQGAQETSLLDPVSVPSTNIDMKTQIRKPIELLSILDRNMVEEPLLDLLW